MGNVEITICYSILGMFDEGWLAYTPYECACVRLRNMCFSLFERVFILWDRTLSLSTSVFVSNRCLNQSTTGTIISPIWHKPKILHQFTEFGK